MIVKTGLRDNEPFHRSERLFVRSKRPAFVVLSYDEASGRRDELDAGCNVPGAEL
ncbi:hypothetical protein D3C71_2079520 [compost metagenome]